VGDKYKLINEIKQYFPANISNFIEPFAGGGSVFMNVIAEKYFLNDIDKNVVSLHTFLIEQSKNPKLFFQNIENKVNEYGFSFSCKSNGIPQDLKDNYKKTYFAKFNKDGFERLRTDYNQSQERDVLTLYLLLIYGFNRMLRFNSQGNFNLPVGNVDFNSNVVLALNHYFKLVSEKKIQWFNLDYKDFINTLEIAENDFIYFDPPYLITFSEYNKLWNDDIEKEFVEFLTDLHSKGVKFAVSNVISYKDKENNIFKDWAKSYFTIPIKSNYISYHDNSIKNFQEVLVTNYEQKKIQLQTTLVYDYNEKS
jgi:DNA adenine methylase